MRDIPLSVYAAWPAPNYKNPVTRGNELLIINIIFIILVTFSIVIRVMSRMKQARPGLDDIFIVIAYFFTIGLTAVVIMANKSYGWDRHVWDVPLDVIRGASILAFCAKLTFVCASNFTRLSLIFLYYRLIKESTIKWYRWSIHFGLVFNVAVFIVLLFIGIFGCVPVRKYWSFPEVIDGHCLDEGVITMAAGVMSCVADLLCTILPIPIIMRLHMPLRDRIGVVVLLSAGIIVTIAGVLRTVFIWQSLISTYDESWGTYPLWICAAVEIDLAVICACVPAMKAVLWKPFQRWTGSLYSNYRSSNRTSNNDKSKVELTSQDPIVDDSEAGGNYRLTSMDFGKRSSPNDSEEERYPGRVEGRTESRLEKTLARLPSASYPGRHGKDSKHTSPQSEDSSHSKLEISKETSIQISSISNDEDLKEQERDEITTLPTKGRTGLRNSKPSQYNATPNIDWD